MRYYAETRLWFAFRCELLRPHALQQLFRCRPERARDVLRVNGVVQRAAHVVEDRRQRRRSPPLLGQRDELIGDRAVGVRAAGGRGEKDQDALDGGA